MPETLPLPQREVAASPEKGHRGKISPAAVWVASGILAEHAGSRKAEDVDSVIGNLAARKAEDLTPHHEKVGAFSTKQRAEHWEKRIAEEPNLVSKDEQISKWQDGVIDYVAKLQKQGKRDNLYAVLETLGIGEDALNHGEDFPSVVRQRVEAFRQAFLVGDAKIDMFATYFTHERSLEDNLTALHDIEGFLGVFGGQETVQLVKDAIVAHAFVDELQTDKKDELLETAKEALGEELPEETAALYGRLYEKPQDMKPGEEHAVVTPLTESDQQVEPAPLMPPSPEEETQGLEGEEDSEKQQGDGETEAGKVLSYGEFQQAVMEKELGKYPELKAWFEQESAKLPEMTVEIGGRPMTDSEKWTANIVDVDGKQELMGVDSANKFFAFRNTRVFKDGKLSHDQPGLLEDTVEVTINTEYGKVAFKTSGFVGVIKDSEGNVLVGTGQEPLANTPNHVVVKDPLQTSGGKFKLLMGDPDKGIQPDPTKDKLFYDTLSMLFPGENPFDLFLEYVAKPDTIWPMGPVNGNRIDSENISFEMVVDDSQKEALTLNGVNRWVNPDERRALERAGLLNLIGTGAFTAV